tara:strand:+ start:177 stop:446 length:270 start_codon:yes stop_codon:yes gene_type:complete
MSQHDQSYIEKFQSEDTTYNGWANRATWNIALWINNDQGIQSVAKECDDYADFREFMREIDVLETPDGVAYNDSALDVDSLNEVIVELA